MPFLTILQSKIPAGLGPFGVILERDTCPTGMGNTCCITSHLWGMEIATIFHRFSRPRAQDLAPYGREVAYNSNIPVSVFIDRNDNVIVSKEVDSPCPLLHSRVI